MDYNSKVKILRKFMDSYDMEGVCGYWIQDREEENEDFIVLYLVIDNGNEKSTFHAKRITKDLISQINKWLGFDVYIGSIGKNCSEEIDLKDDEVLSESMPLKFKRRLSFKDLKDDVEYCILDNFNDPCEYGSVGEFIAEVCDYLKDDYIGNFKFRDDDVTPKERDDLYYALVDLFGGYLSEYYNNICKDKKTRRMSEQKNNKIKRVIRLTESELINLLKKLIKEDLEDNFIDDEDIDGEDEIQDFGFDYEEDDDDMEKIRNRRKFRRPPMEYGRSEWNKEWEKPYSPIKPSDLPLDKYLMSKK